MNKLVATLTTGTIATIVAAASIIGSIIVAVSAALSQGLL